MSQPSDIDRLVEEGLNLYGAGDLDGALLAWEQALAADPDNAQANSYVDYVRMNYELLTNGEPEVAEGDTSPFGIEEEPEYQIEIVPGQLIRDTAAPPISLDPLDDGWFMDETVESASAPVPPGYEPEAPLIPPPAPSNQLPMISGEFDVEPEISFESSTREYHGSQPPPFGAFTTPEPTVESYSDDASGDFQPERTPVGFTNQLTDIRKRDLGFVQPVAAQPDLKVTVRNPTRDGSNAPAPELSRSTGPKSSIELGAAGASADELIASLPSPRPAPPRAPQIEDIALSSQPTRDLERVPTQQLPSARQLGILDEPVIGAPTRELGLRPGGRLPTNNDDLPTRESDVRAIRQSHAKKAEPIGEGTRHDIVLPFDPIDARSAQILDDVDAEAPPNEPKEDRPRRRITTLLDRALGWNSQGELDKAVTAVDLALSEDPNSALAQKLIHRNRDTILTIFQSFLGDLDRQPQLARPLHELASAPISPRAAFLLSRIDGMVSIDEILDISGMPRLEALRHLCQLFLRGILR